MCKHNGIYDLRTDKYWHSECPELPRQEVIEKGTCWYGYSNNKGCIIMQCDNCLHKFNNWNIVKELKLRKFR